MRGLGSGNEQAQAGNPRAAKVGRDPWGSLPSRPSQVREFRGRRALTQREK